MRLAAIGFVAVALLGFFMFLTTRITSAPMAVLFTELEQPDAAAIAGKLEGMKVPYEVSADGKTVKVPSDQVGKARMALAGEGLPKGGSIGYEIFDQKEGFGTTSFVQNLNHLRALEGELARTISTLGPVMSARVHLVLPQRELFSRTETSASASVFLKLRGATQITREQIAAIQNLIAAAVPQLQPNRISIVDDKGNLLARPTDNANASTVNTNQDELRASFEQAQARKIEDLLAQTLGYGRVRAQVSAELDFDRITTQSEIYDPESQVVRSQQQVTEENANKDGGGGAGAASVSSNLPGSLGQTAPEGEATGSSSNRSEQTLNYEINKTVRSQVHEAGKVRRLSVAVVVDGSYKTGEDKKQEYVPRTPEEMEQIKSLVRSAVSFNPARGDTLEVANMRFFQPDEPTMNDAINRMFGMATEDLFRLMPFVQTIVLGGLGFLIIFLIARPLLRHALDSVRSMQEEQANALTGGGIPQLSGPGSTLNRELMSEAAEAESAIEQMIDISRVEGRVKASSIRKVGEIVEKHPEESVSILRNWMYQENR